MEGGSSPPGPVCVTGATGFVALWLIMRLLQLGYTVRATIRPSQAKQHVTVNCLLLAVADGKDRNLGFLRNLLGAPERLQIFTADLSDPESFKEAIQGCIGVFHVATPMDFEDREPEPVVTQRAIDGTLGILRASLESQTVKRVVYTSSTSAVCVNATAVGAGPMDESCWSDIEYIRAVRRKRVSYAILKTLTEKAVLEFGELNGLDVVTIVPPFVAGPFVCDKFPVSVRVSMAMIFGDLDEFPCPRRLPLIHVDDLASAHIFLLNHPRAKGRYVCSSEFLTSGKMSKFLSEKYPDQFPVPSSDRLKQMTGLEMPEFSSKKLLDLGFEFKHGFEDIFDGAIQCCRQKGYL